MLVESDVQFEMAGPFELVVEVEASKPVEVGLVSGLWNRVDLVGLDRRIHEGGKKQEKSEEVEVGWARWAWEGRVIGLGSVAWVAILNLYMRNEEKEDMVWVGRGEY
ncbi:hypothetical protein TorRG33x02_100180 [Trema orientale]|uniref:Uncharacterized protein n=1 Tax=Trema orientale TaxID=63057 RepID=A0A2P5F901_TREOI|nr:hypothetical protein TorRG33x02_100180 [Trema orientale]